MIMAGSVLFQAFRFPLLILAKLFVMSKGFLLLGFELLLVWVTLFSEQAGTTYIDRLTRGDMFQNLPRNISKDCDAKGASCGTIGGVADDKVCERNCCFCRCKQDRPTYLVREGRCVEDGKLLDILKKGAQGCDYRFVVSGSSQAVPSCKQKVLTSLDTTKGATNQSMVFCLWKTGNTKIHSYVAKGIKSCSIIPSKSFYLYNGTWNPMWSDEAADSQNIFNVYVEGNNTSAARILLEWSKELPPEYAGLVFNLKFRCRKVDNHTINSCLVSKISGTFTGTKPTFYPPTTTIFASATTTRRSTTATVTSSNAVEPNTVVSMKERTHKDNEKFNVVVLVLAIVGALLLFILLFIALWMMIQRRRKRAAEKSQPRENPSYQKGPSTSLKLKDVNAEEGDAEQRQSFIANSPRDRGKSAPVYHHRPKSKGAPTPEGTSSTDPDLYQCLIKEDVGGGDYQVLLDDGKLLDPQEEEEDVHEYHVLESEEASTSSDSYSVDMPPLQNKKKNCTAETSMVDNLLDELHDYDEPEELNERKGKASGPLRDTNELKGDKDKRAALLDYDEPECVISDDTDLDTKATLHPDDNPLNNSEPVAALFDPHDYAELDE